MSTHEELEQKATTLAFWLDMRQAISYGMALSDHTKEQLDLATDNAVRAVLREVFDWGVERTTEHLKKLREGME
jgi:hypothetical protein